MAINCKKCNNLNVTLNLQTKRAFCNDCCYAWKHVETIPEGSEKSSKTKKKTSKKTKNKPE